MFLTLAAVVLCASILVFFSQEFINLFKKIFAVKGALLIIPLALCSWAVYAFDYWFSWAIYYYHETLQSANNLLMSLMPFNTGAYSVALISVLTLSSVLPVYILNWFAIKKTYKPYPYPYVTSTLIWIINSVVLIIMELS